MIFIIILFAALCIGISYVMNRWGYSPFDLYHSSPIQILLRWILGPFVVGGTLLYALAVYVSVQDNQKPNPAKRADDQVASEVAPSSNDLSGQRTTSANQVSPDLSQFPAEPFRWSHISSNGCRWSIRQAGAWFLLYVDLGARGVARIAVEPGFMRLSLEQMNNKADELNTRINSGSKASSSDFVYLPSGDLKLAN